MRRLLIIGVTAVALVTAGVASGQTPDEWAALLARVVGIEQKNTEQDARIAELEARVNVLQGDVSGVWTWADEFVAYQLAHNDRSLRLDRRIARCAALAEPRESVCLARVVRQVSRVLAVGGFAGIGLRKVEP